MNRQGRQGHGGGHAVEASVGVVTVGDGVVGTELAEAGVAAKSVGCAVDLHAALRLHIERKGLRCVLIPCAKLFGEIFPDYIRSSKYAYNLFLRERETVYFSGFRVAKRRFYFALTIVPNKDRQYGVVLNKEYPIFE